MADAVPLLQTKLHAPRRRGAVARPRLRAQLDRRGQPALTLVSAAAGFGKTTLVAEWFATGPATAWVSLDRRDNDPGLFWAYVLAALRTATADTAEEVGAAALRLLEAPQPSLEAVVATLLNDLYGVDHDVVLVLDDYHVIDAPEIHDSVAYLLGGLPPHVHLVLATRADPPLPLAELRARGELLEIRAAELRFTSEEAAAYLNDAMDLTLTPADVELLEARTEGWIAALQLAALSMQGRDDITGFIGGFAGDDRFILDYLVGEVLDRQDAEVRRFLLETSILSRLTGPLCDAVTGRAGGRAALEQLERANLFVVPLDDRRTWYRYHHLFADVLRARLLDESPALVAELHQRASAWYEAHGEPGEAIAHAMAGDDPERAARLIELAAPTMQQRRQEATILRWVEALPGALFADRPVLTMTLVGARMATGDPSGVEPLLAQVETRLATTAPPPTVFDDEAFRQIPAMLSIYRAALALLAGDTAGTIAHASQVLDLVEPSEHFRRGAATALLGLAHWADGDLVAAERCYAGAVDSFLAIGHLPDMLGVSLALADIQMAQGKLGDAARTFRSGMQCTDEHPGLRGAADMHVGLSEVLIERNALDEAAQHLDASTELGTHAGLPQHPYRWRVATARLLAAQGDLDGAAALLEEAEPLYMTDFSPPVRPVTALLARVHLALGDLAAARRWAAGRGLTAEDELTYVDEFAHITFARILLAEHRADQGQPSLAAAIGLLQRLLAAAEAGHRSGSAIEILVLLAAAQLAHGDTGAASATLEDAVGRAEAEGFVRVFLDAGPDVTALVRSLAAHDGAPAGIRQIAAATEPARPPAPSPSVLVDELSARELDVLRLLRSDLSGPEIARELLVSLNTFRTHTKNIYAKLGVTNRREAITRAAELGL